jgi:hypothetical protein
MRSETGVWRQKGARTAPVCHANHNRARPSNLCSPPIDSFRSGSEALGFAPLADCVGKPASPSASSGAAGYRRVGAVSSQFTPSFFCKLVDDVVYWKTSFFSGYT